MNKEKLLHEAETVFAQQLQLIEDQELRESISKVAMIVNELNEQKGFARGLSAMQEATSLAPYVLGYGMPASEFITTKE